MDAAFTDRIAYYGEKGSADLVRRAETERICHLAVNVAGAVRRDGWDALPERFRYPSPEVLPVLEESMGRAWIHRQVENLDPGGSMAFWREFFRREEQRAALLIGGVRRLFYRESASEMLPFGRPGNCRSSAAEGPGSVLFSMADEQGLLPLFVLQWRSALTCQGSGRM